MRRLRKITIAYKDFINQEKVRKVILHQASHEKNIIYGAQSIKKQIGIFARPTYDYDIFSSKPKTSAVKTEKKLDKVYNENLFYVKPAMHPGTYKVMNEGTDGKKNTDDDYGVADYTKMPKPIPKYKEIGGVRYRALSEESKAKIKALKDKAYAYRHAKDREDYNRIKASGGIK